MGSLCLVADSLYAVFPAAVLNSWVEIQVMMSNAIKQNIILWADDDADDLFLVKEAVENIADSFQIVEASNGRQALDLLHSLESSSHLPCLVVLDINMPVMNGKETLAVLRKDDRYKSVPVAVFTTSTSEKDRLYCERLGAQMFSKPHTYRSFEKMIGKLISFCKPGKENISALQ
ncbi:MAG TPA: response regulator [Flavisolibacter sp.]|nr:response regulator [Flavisolibacter sp.]